LLRIVFKHTLRSNFVDACFNKGGRGNGYYDIRGDYNLIVDERVRRIRHFAIQNGAKYNVVINCDIEVDVNFHNGDDGFNLIEQNKIKSEQWRSWGAFASGGARFGHDEPGDNNIIFNNDVTGKNNSARFGGDTKVFVFDQYRDPRLLRNSAPRGGTFYPAILDDSVLSINSFGKEQDTDKKQIILYPNPFASRVSIKNYKVGEFVTIYAINGALIKTIKLDESGEISLHNIPNKICFLKYKNKTVKLIQEQS